MKTSPLPLPPDVRAAAEDILGHDGIREEFAWMSWAGTVWRLNGERGTLFLKRAADLEGERARLVWLDGRWPVPRTAGFFHELGDDWLLTHPVPGVPMSDKSLGWEPDRVARSLGAFLRELHATDAVGCPFGVAKPGNVLIHGDFCLPNVAAVPRGLRLAAHVGRRDRKAAPEIFPLDRYSGGRTHCRKGLGPRIRREGRLVQSTAAACVQVGSTMFSTARQQYQAAIVR